MPDSSYDPNFALADPSPESDGYFGASLSALHLLGRSNGYRLIGANGPNTNAFFMRGRRRGERFPGGERR